jgi:hypothetical protein
MNNNLNIFNKYLNNKSLSFEKKNYFVGKSPYSPSVSQEWKSSIYSFNLNNIKNLPIYNLNINSLLKNYFNLYFNTKFMFNKLKFRKSKYLSLNKIYVSKAEIKHTSNKAIITVYVYNREKIALLKKMKSIKKSFFSKIKLLKCFLHEEKLSILISSLKKDQDSFLHQDLILLRKYKLLLNLNKSKFEEKLLFKLNNLIIKLFNKKVEFNIVSMKSILLNSEFFTKLFIEQIKDKKANIVRMMNVILNKVILPTTNRVVEKSAVIKSVDLNLLENKFETFNLSSVLKNYNLSDLLNSLYYSIISKKNLNKNYAKIYEIIFNSINYKNIGGVRLEVKGRLTKRNRADRSLFKVKWKGGLKNIDSSYKGLSSVNIRGYAKSNLEYSIFTSKRSVGAFAVKGWVSGK